MANEDLKAFDYSVSNALQAPLRIISGFCSILLEENIEQLDEKGAKYLDRIFDSVESCRTLVNELLKMSRVTRKELEKEQLNISKLVKAEYFKTLSKYNLNEVSLILAERMIVEADPYLLSFALNAIIDNSVKSMISNDKPSLKVSFEEKNDVTEFCIEDNGIGFSHDRARKIFEPFHSYHTDVDFTGSGLGLATAERIIRRHGGRIWAESEEGRGKVFFTL